MKRESRLALRKPNRDRSVDRARERDSACTTVECAVPGYLRVHLGRARTRARQHSAHEAEGHSPPGIDGGHSTIACVLRNEHVGAGFTAACVVKTEPVSAPSITEAQRALSVSTGVQRGSFSYVARRDCS